MPAPDPPLALDLGPPLAEVTAEAACPHLAILLRSREEVPAAQASFYALGLRRGAWLMHRSLPGRGERERAELTAAGLPVAALERERRLDVCELPLDDPPERWALPWVRVLEERLARGFTSVWWSRFPIGADDATFPTALAYDRAWEAAFHGRPAVSLCVYVVGELDEQRREHRLAALAEIHDGVLASDEEGVALAGRRGAGISP